MSPPRPWPMLAAVAFALSTGGATASAQGVFFGWKLEEFQPDIANGGRVNTIAVNPRNNDHLIVASETGGLFRSTDRGVTWKHIDALPEYGTVSVAYLPTDTAIVIATVAEDTRVANGGGIWRSTDGGITWTQLPGPSAPAGVTERVNAFDIAIAPDNGTIYVGDQYGLSISRDKGATWTHVDPFGTGARVVSVAAQSGNRVIAGGSASIMRSSDGGSTWLPPTPGSTPGPIVDVHALTGSPFGNDQAYAVNGWRRLMFTEDGGNHWTQIMSAPPGAYTCGGISFIKVIGRTKLPPSRPPRPRSLDLYFGNRCWLWILHAPEIAGTDKFDYSGTWLYPTIDHGDTRDLAFTTGKSRSPLILGTDGGLHRTTTAGMNWNFVGGGHNGFNALQITEVKGQWITTPSRYDLYFGTQDNDLWASGNAGTTWTNRVCCEGFFIELEHRVAATLDSKTTFMRCGNCLNRIANPLFTAVTQWPDPSTPAVGSPRIIRKSFHVQGVDSNAAFMARGLASSGNLGSAWAQYASFLEDRHDLPKLSRPGTTDVLYQAIRTGWDPVRKIDIDKLVRVSKIPPAGATTVTYPLMNNFGGLGINPTMFAWYEVFAVDPGNTQHLIAPDVINEKMMQTMDGGDNWTEIPNLTSQITANGQLLFRRAIFPQASAVSFSPDDPNIVAIGTWQNGLFMSKDRGATWYRVPGSEQVTYITSIEWRTANDAVISTYGRGLWKVYWGMLQPLPDFEKLCKAPCIVLPIPPVLEVEKLTHAVLVFGGAVQGARVTRGIMRELFVSPGSSVVFFSDTRKDMDIKVTESKRRVGFGSLRIPAARPRQLLVGLTLGARRNPIGAAFSEQMLAMYEPTEQEKAGPREPTGAAESPTARRPYLILTLPGGAANTVAPEGPIKITLRNFPRTPLEIAIDSMVVARVTGGDNREVTITVKAPREFGLHYITVREPATGRVLDGANFIVRGEDSERGERR